jgi:hypothetical protein
MAHVTNTAKAEGLSGWNGVRAAIDTVTSSQLDHFDPNTIANALDVLPACANFRLE